MPTYEYACQSCGHELETFQRMSDPPLETCPSCTEPALKRKIGRGAGIIFKGGGFYETDFKERKGKPESSTTSEPAKTSSDSPGGGTAKPEKPSAASPKPEA